MSTEQEKIAEISTLRTVTDDDTVTWSAYATGDLGFDTGQVYSTTYEAKTYILGLKSLLAGKYTNLYPGKAVLYVREDGEDDIEFPSIESAMASLYELVLSKQ